MARQESAKPAFEVGIHDANRSGAWPWAVTPSWTWCLGGTQLGACKFGLNVASAAAAADPRLPAVYPLTPSEGSWSTPAAPRTLRDKAPRPPMTQICLRVSGIVCDGCRTLVEAALRDAEKDGAKSAVQWSECEGFPDKGDVMLHSEASTHDLIAAVKATGRECAMVEPAVWRTTRLKRPRRAHAGRGRGRGIGERRPGCGAGDGGRHGVGRGAGGGGGGGGQARRGVGRRGGPCAGPRGAGQRGAGRRGGGADDAPPGAPARGRHDVRPLQRPRAGGSGRGAWRHLGRGGPRACGGDRGWHSPGECAGGGGGGGGQLHLRGAGGAPPHPHRGGDARRRGRRGGGGRGPAGAAHEHHPAQGGRHDVRPLQRPRRAHAGRGRGRGIGERRLGCGTGDGDRHGVGRGAGGGGGGGGQL
eukprot:scaffold47655_cov58-Phaeocystis_antarctica.AAC.4